MDEAARLLAHGVQALRSDDLDGAIAALERAVEIDPRRRRAFLLLGLAHERRGDPDMARAAFAEAGVDPSAEDRVAMAPAPPPVLPPGVALLPADAAGLAIVEGGLLLAPATGGTCSRLRRPVLMVGDVRFEPLGRRRHGIGSNEPLDGDGGALYRLVGVGSMLLSPAGGTFTRIELGADPCYVREANLEAFDGALVLDSGRLPGRGEHVVAARLRGSGAVVLHTRKPPLAFPMAAGRRVQVVPDSVIGWIGTIVPFLHPGSDGQVPTLFCDGAGVLLLEAPAPEAAS